MYDYDAIRLSLHPRSAFQQEVNQLFNLLFSGEKVRIVIFETHYVFEVRFFYGKFAQFYLIKDAC